MDKDFQIMAELSLYPLKREYDGPILELIAALRTYPGIRVTPGETSTVIQGAYREIFRILEKECRVCLGGEYRSVLVMKLINFE